MRHVFTITLPLDEQRRNRIFAGLDDVERAYPVSTLIQDALVVTIAEPKAAAMLRQIADAWYETLDVGANNGYRHDHTNSSL